jgi:hypothetical protein
MKYFPVKNNGDLRKTPLKGNTLLELYSEIKKYYDYDFSAHYEYLMNTEDEISEYAIVNYKKLSPKEFFGMVKDEIDQLNIKRQEEIKSLYDSKRKQLEEKIVNFTEEEKKLFHLLHGNLEIEVYPPMYREDDWVGELFFKGVPLKKITVKKSEVSIPKMIFIQ